MGLLMPRSQRTQVGIVGAGPAGLLLSHLLYLCGIGSVVIELRSRAEVETTVRAGVLEQNTVDILTAAGLGARLRCEGQVHHGINLRFAKNTHRIDMHRLTSGRAITVYAQQEVLKDLIGAAIKSGRQVVFEAKDVRLHDLNTSTPRITFSQLDGDDELVCDFVAGCDGFHGVARQSLPPQALQTFHRDYQIGWLGILVAAPPSSQELIYARHDSGFALLSTRSPQLQRMYVQCDPLDDLAHWPDERIWQELATRLESREPWELIRGPIVQKGIVGMRSFVAEPMQHGRLYLAGDAAHIVPPAGAKGLNLAVADVAVLAAAVANYFQCGGMELLKRYSAICLPRIWRAQRFSNWMTSTLHVLPKMDSYQKKIQLAELEDVIASPGAARNLAENYVGFPLPQEATRVPWSELAARSDLTIGTR